ncbi:hypothetical protein GCM10009760_45340 [Kitasatospora kazusensis]|uniref:Cytochrome P450 n=1 Tax=Kitasatospora kazusensis TaxID=407974 RepID=A0ABN2ZZC2_9ACTN
MAPLHSLPRAPKGLPLLGHALPLMRDPLSFVKSLRRSGELVRVSAGGMQIL